MVTVDSAARATSRRFRVPIAPRFGYSLRESEPVRGWNGLESFEQM